MDMSQDIYPSAFDGVHLDEHAHKIYADLVYKKITEIFPDFERYFPQSHAPSQFVI